MKTGILWLVLILYPALLYGQDSSYVMRHIRLDSLTVTATHYGFNVQGFIQRVKQDTTFYKAFKTLRILSYTEKNDIRILDKQGKVKASLLSTTKQHRTDSCRTTEVLNEHTTGRFYKNDHDYNYYTATLYADLFFTNGKVCGENNIVQAPEKTQQGGSALDRHEDQLKQLIFNPGQPIRGIPFIGNKVALFDDDIAPMYNFSIRSTTYDTTDCYVFTAIVKPAYKDKAVINRLITYFSKRNMEIVYRDYALSYQTFLFHFDVNMQVNMTHFRGEMVPKSIHYQGDWKVLFKKEENAVFSTTFSHFSVGETHHPRPDQCDDTNDSDH